MSTLTANVVQGNVRDAPAGSKVPLWVRKVLLRGLMPRAKDRWPSMEALIEALGKDPSVQRRKWLAAAGGMMVIGGMFLGGRASSAIRSQVCSGGPPKLAGIWDLPKPGEPEPARHAQIRKAFLATGKSYAPDVFATVSRALTTYAQNWANMYKETCEATRGASRTICGGDGPADGVPAGTSRRRPGANRTCSAERPARLSRSGQRSELR